ncbi:hypothetical protein L9F63_006520 [Diploptera punctata]|uniref:Uncharacterized protein n=1 Tax=Diploptera punctata TaxID=6984 RepID=A0AAD7ZB23_DIPPU|nr:hypothetical protein L9F63_006520 [Diploptera punctata]
MAWCQECHRVLSKSEIEKFVMYKRRFTNRTSKSSSATQVTTSTPKSTVEVENDPSRSNFPMSGISVESSPTQKRKVNETDRQIVSENAKKIKTCTYSSCFEEVVSKAGFVFKNGDSPHVLTRDQAIFIRDVTTYLKKNMSFPKNVDEFFAGFEKHCSSNSNLKMVLTHTKTSSDCTDARGAVQESLVRLLLSVEPLQSKVLEFLLEKVAEFALIGDDDPDSNDVPWVRIILRQMRLLDRIVDGSSLNDRLFSVLETAPLDVQREIIFCLPDIISDEQHHEAALKLSKLLKTNFQLTAAIMEALNSLNLQSNLRAEVCEHMLQALNKAPPEFLPAIITFLVSSEGQVEDLTEVISGLRQKLDLSTAGGLDGSTQVLIMSALSSGALSCRKLVDIWLKTISSMHSSSDLTLLDMAVLLLLHHSLPARKKNIHNILRNRIKAGVITEAVVEKTFTMLLVPIKEYVKTALNIATVLFKSPDPPVNYIGKVWFKLMLINLEGHLVQSVILELLLLIGTGGMAIATLALGVMSEVEPRYLHSQVLLLMVFIL